MAEVTEAVNLSKVDASRIPAHVAIIMDGNGRWAKNRGLERGAGHVEGVNTVRRITAMASDMGVRFLTLYAFSTENWNRPKAEVDMLMHLIAMAIENETPALLANNVRVVCIGDFERMPDDAKARLRNSMNATAACTGLTLALALSYSARWEINAACRSIARDVAAGRLGEDDITDELISSRLSTAGFPDPDLLIRTGGDLRVSNFLLWQIAYAEIEVVDKFWPEYTKQDFVDAIVKFQSRERRFGKTSEQLK